MIAKYSINFILKQVGAMVRATILALFYFIRLSSRLIKKIFSFRQLPLAVVIVLFSLFSYLEVQTAYQDSFENNLLAKIAAVKEDIFIETSLSIPEKSIIEGKQGADFKIAAFREQVGYSKNEEIVEEEYDKEQEIVLTLGGSALVAPNPAFDPSKLPTRTEIEKYLVQTDDTISTIAEKFGLKWNTLLWENNLNSWSIIKPGDELKILPVDGLTHKVKKGDTLSSLAQKYRTSLENIVKFNGFNPDSILEPGTTILIPDGTPPPPPQPVIQNEPIFVQENYSNYSDWRKNTKCHKFVIRQCTDWAAFKWATEQGQCVPSWGDAKNWFPKAKKSGYATGDQPRQGAIIVLTCTSWICQRYGHVGYVESFNSSTVTFSEMNGLKPRAYSEVILQNTTNAWQKGWKIIGYIYP